MNAPLKINMEPKNGVLEDDFPFQTGDFQVPAVNLAGCTLIELSGYFEQTQGQLLQGNSLNVPRLYHFSCTNFFQHCGRGFARKPVRKLAVPDSTCVTRKGCTTPVGPVEYHNTTSSQVHRQSFRKLEEHVQKTRPSKHGPPLKNSHVFPVFPKKNRLHPNRSPNQLRNKKSLTPPAKLKIPRSGSKRTTRKDPSHTTNCAKHTRCKLFHGRILLPPAQKLFFYVTMEKKW